MPGGFAEGGCSARSGSLRVTAPQISVSDVQAPIAEQEARQEGPLPGPRVDFPDNAGGATAFPRATEQPPYSCSVSSTRSGTEA